MPRRRIVLLVEPDSAVQNDFRAALEARGFQVLAADEPAAGLALARARQPGVIVGDFPMDVPGGGAFTAEVRADPRLREAVIITVTARHLTGRDSPAWRNSDRVLSKPIAPERLAEEVIWALDRPRSVGE